MKKTNVALYVRSHRSRRGEGATCVRHPASEAEMVMNQRGIYRKRYHYLYCFLRVRYTILPGGHEKSIYISFLLLSK